MAGEHMTGAALIALIAVLQNIAIAKSFGRELFLFYIFNSLVNCSWKSNY